MAARRQTSRESRRRRADADDRPLDRPVHPVFHVEAAGGVVLLACTILALAMANSPWSAAVASLWHMPVGITIGDTEIHMSLLHWINDGLMTIFFFLIGLKIKRELVHGELRDPRGHWRLLRRRARTQKGEVNHPRMISGAVDIGNGSRGQCGMARDEAMLRKVFAAELFRGVTLLFENPGLAACNDAIF